MLPLHQPGKPFLKLYRSSLHLRPPHLFRGHLASERVQIAFQLTHFFLDPGEATGEELPLALERGELDAQFSHLTDEAFTCLLAGRPLSFEPGRLKLRGMVSPLDLQ